MGEPLSLSDSAFLDEAKRLVDVRATQTLPAFAVPLLGPVGPLTAAESATVPVAIMRLLREEEIASPLPPPCLSRNRLEDLLRAERNDPTRLRPLAVPEIAELSRILLLQHYPLHQLTQSEREETLKTLEELSAVRVPKLHRLRSQLLAARAVDVSGLSSVERRQMAADAVDIMNALETHPAQYVDFSPAEEVLVGLELLQAEQHFELLRRAQGILDEADDEEEEDNVATA